MCISIHAYCILQTIAWVQGISKFGAKWYGTFATALPGYSYDNFQQISCRAQTGMYEPLQGCLGSATIMYMYIIVYITLIGMHSPMQLMHPN